MIIKDFMDILAWQKAQVLTVELYKSLDMEDVFLKQQILRASAECTSLIAAGFERWSLGDFKEFLYLAKTKSAETRTLLSVAKDLGQIDNKMYDALNVQVEDVSKLIYGFVKTFLDKKKKPTEE